VARVATPRIGLLLALVALASVAAVARAQTGDRQTASTLFDEPRPGHSTGLRLAIDYVDPSAPDGKPPAVQKVVTRLAAGTRVDTSVPEACTASDAALMAEGAAACPPGSRVGGGEIALDTGVPGPGRISENDATLLNNGTELVFLLESKRDPPSRTVSRATVEGTTITSEVPPVPGGPPDGFLAIKRVRLAVQARSVGQGPGRRDYVTTPRECPASGAWTNTATFTYRDGVSQTVSTRSACRRPAPRADHKPPRIRIAGVPLRRCARRDFRARVRVAERWSGLRRAELFLGARRLLATNSKAFSRRIRVRRLRGGRHRLTVTAIDNIGNRSVRTVRFRRCGR
jgi:hypothetical protein